MRLIARARLEGGPPVQFRRGAPSAYAQVDLLSYGGIGSTRSRRRGTHFSERRCYTESDTSAHSMHERELIESI